jgi:hypothetical protein
MPPSARPLTGCWLVPWNNDDVAKIPPYGVTAFFQDLDILMYAFVPEKPPSLVGRNFCLAIVRVFAKASIMKWLEDKRAARGNTWPPSD